MYTSPILLVMICALCATSGKDFKPQDLILLMCDGLFGNMLPKTCEMAKQAEVLFQQRNSIIGAGLQATQTSVITNTGTSAAKAIEASTGAGLQATQTSVITNTGTSAAKAIEASTATTTTQTTETTKGTLYSPDNETIAVPLSTAGISIENMTSLTYQVKACNDAHIIIQRSSTPDFHTDGNYVFSLGSHANQHVEIKRALHKSAFPNHHLEEVLSCSEYRSFWISWKDQVLRIGKGDELYKNEMVNASVPSTSGYKYGFVLSGWGSSAHWKIRSY